MISPENSLERKVMYVYTLVLKGVFLCRISKSICPTGRNPDDWAENYIEIMIIVYFSLWKNVEGSCKGN